MQGPILARRDRIFHQGTTRLEVLGAPGFLCLALHFLHLAALRMGLRPRVISEIIARIAPVTPVKIPASMVMIWNP
jgi:hypothetical protein